MTRTVVTLQLAQARVTSQQKHMGREGSWAVTAGLVGGSLAATRSKGAIPPAARAASIAMAGNSRRIQVGVFFLRGASGSMATDS